MTEDEIKELREAVVEAARQGYRPQRRRSFKNPLYVPPTPAGREWTHLYGTCRSFAEWATQEAVTLAFAGRDERTDDQARNIAAIRRATKRLNEIVAMMDEKQL
jgi:hypothetical protein